MKILWMFIGILLAVQVGVIIQLVFFSSQSNLFLYSNIFDSKFFSSTFVSKYIAKIYRMVHTMIHIHIHIVYAK